jgi:hypothetical protein
VVALGGEHCVDGVLTSPSLTLDAADELGRGLAEELLARGADGILDGVRSSAGREPVPEP